MYSFDILGASGFVKLYHSEDLIKVRCVGSIQFGVLACRQKNYRKAIINSVVFTYIFSFDVKLMGTLARLFIINNNILILLI